MAFAFKIDRNSDQVHRLRLSFRLPLVDDQTGDGLLEPLQPGFRDTRAADVQAPILGPMCGQS